MTVKSSLRYIPDVDEFLKKALEEDIGQGDLTTDTFIPKDCMIEGEWFAKEPCCIAGLDVVRRLFGILDPAIKVFWNVEDGDQLDRGPFGIIKGTARSILKGERTALNLMQRLSGIATLTSLFVKKARPYGVQILDTRKTTPLLRVLEKYAVRMGGGVNHRMGLGEMVLLKDNHRFIIDELKIADLRKTIQSLREQKPAVKIGIEVTKEAEIQDALKSGADFILLDNMVPEEVCQIVGRWKGKVLLEVSGGINLENVESYAKTGVDRISIGALTHSARSVDISLEVLSVNQLI